MKNALTKLGHDVLQAFNGKEGVDMFRSQSPDVTFCDIEMPDMDGLGFLQETKNQGGKKYIITNKRTEAIVAQCQELGATDVLMKMQYEEFFQKIVGG